MSTAKRIGSGAKQQIMQRTDIPYAQRLQMKKQAQIAAHRDDAAMVALQIACIALNDTEHLGYVRISRFAKHLQELLEEFYSDRVVGEAHVAARLREMGFVVEDGHMYCLEDLQGKLVKAPKGATSADYETKEENA